MHPPKRWGDKKPGETTTYVPWDDVILNVQGRNLTGGAARARIIRDHGEHVSDKVKKLVVLKGKSGTITARDTIRAVFKEWYGSSVSLKGDPQPVVVQPIAPIVVVQPPPALLQLFMDVDRNGVIDALPATNADWTWGPAGVGAIITVKSRVYGDGDNVMERSSLELAWRGATGVGWTATLAVDHPTRIRIFRSRVGNAERVLGGDIAGPLSLDGDATISGALGRGERVSLWMEAVDYPATTPEADWKVRLTFTFILAGVTTTQVAMLRIAPWIMGSDLDTSDHVYVRVTAAAVGTQELALATEVSNFTNPVCTLFPVAANQPTKGFARDVMKSGYTAGPHYSGVVIQGQLDLSPIRALPARAAADTSGAVIIKPNGAVEAGLGGQDNGGNLLVSPPSDAYPWGRIIFGGDDGDFPCHSEAFYRAQAVQRPIRLNSTWLRVGHVDEMLSFVLGTDGVYRALLMSPRLAYIMLRGVASSRVFADAAAIATWAVGVNDLVIADGEYTEGSLDNRIGALEANVPPANPPIILTGVPAYVAAPPVPGLDRYVIARVDGTTAIEQMDGRPPVGARLLEYRAAYPTDQGRVCFELSVHASRYLVKTNAVHRQILGFVQPLLDQTRAILLGQLGFTADRILEVPVLLAVEVGSCVAYTGDSVNLLQVAGPASNCMVPKPFGPVFGGEYVYERYLVDRLAAMNVPATIAADDKFHVMEGELHCGTNQTNPPLAGARQRWWTWVAP